MKRKLILSAIMAAFFFNLLLPGKIWGANEPRITADAAVLMDASTGEVLFQRNAHQIRPPASTTKILTALIALELGQLDQVVKVSDRAGKVGESTICLDPGDKMTLEDLIKGALLKSGNDACVAIAEQIAGSEEGFVYLMNLKAKALGAKNSFFTNTNGLPSKDHYSTAYDLAVITCHALNNPKFAQLVKIKETIINKNGGEKLYLKNTNKLLWDYQGATGVKTGTTNAAGKCLVASAKRDSRQLVAVVLHSDSRFRDAAKLLDYGFQGFITRQFLTKGQVVSYYPVPDSFEERSLKLVAGEDLAITWPKAGADKLKTKILLNRKLISTGPGEQVGVYLVTDQGKKIAEVPLLASNCLINRSWFSKPLLIKELLD